MDTTILRSLCNQVITMCDYLDYMTKLHDCNDCGARRTCEHCPKPGAQVRTNCFLWESEKGEEKE